jgi:hypothetical protein
MKTRRRVPLDARLFLKLEPFDLPGVVALLPAFPTPVMPECVTRQSRRICRGRLANSFRTKRNDPLRRELVSATTPLQVSDGASMERLEKFGSQTPLGRAGQPAELGSIYVTQEGSPSLAWRPVSLDHVLGDARLSDLKPELAQFAVDARRTPKQTL